jgi:hypothetical protein
VVGKPLVALLMALAWTGCGPAGEGLGAPGSAPQCVDADGDGFGAGCQFGADCDDEDPEVTRCDDDVIDDGDGGNGNGNGKPTGECKKGDTRECSIDLGTTAGVHTCWYGTQICDEHGEWGSCLTDV